MTRRLARAALRAYPLGFRRRYGPELEALLAETPVTARVLADLVRGALVAHVRAAGPDADVGLEDRLRASASGLLGCWVAVAAAVCAYAKSTEDAPFAAAAHAHPALGAAHAAIAALAGVACAAVVIGAAPLVLVALRVARREPRLRRLLGRAAAAAGLFALLTALLVALAHAEPGATAARAAFIVWALAGLACAAVGVLAARQALFAVPVARGRLLAALAWGTLVAAAMAAMAAATAVYATALALDAPALARAPNGPLSAVDTTASLVVLVVVMAVAGALAATTARRGWRAVARARGA
jgi:hypothetical protein